MATIVLSSLVARSMIQNGYRSSISHPPAGEGKKDREGSRRHERSPLYGFDDS